MSSSGKETFMADYDDVSITFEDQQKINKFARFNAKLEDIKEELKVKQNDMTSLEEACDELALMDESDGKVPYLIGEVFICQNVDFTLQRLEEAKLAKTAEKEKLEAQAEAIKNQMNELKAHLYGKFSTHINLENEDD